ncbi:uncharacterized protein [Glycine max]|uniref:uncharacterized protein isoform X1 n=1 Tax=Glycine max TaxID=3847 RepID=UPI001B357421|nr:uncharacterized protein LOC100815446 isoform X1 [Glycine max]
MKSVEVAKTVLEVADVAWTAVEHTHHLRHRSHPVPAAPAADVCPSDQDLESLRSENRRLRNLLDQNLKLLQNLSEATCFDNCPPDLNDRLVATMRSDEYLTRLKYLQQETASGGNQFPFKEATELDYRSADILVNINSQEPSWWVWVTDEKEPINVEELSGIDDENYLVISEEHVVDGVANFMARCILSNPKALVCVLMEYALLFISFAASDIIFLVIIAEIFSRGTAESAIKSIAWYKQTGKDYGYLGSWKVVLLSVYLGTCFGRALPKSCNFKSCCKGCSFRK